LEYSWEGRLDEIVVFDQALSAWQRRDIFVQPK